MKKIYILLFLAFVLQFQIFAQSIVDRSQVVQICVDLPELQSVYPTQFSGLLRGIFAVSEQNIDIPKGIKISASGVTLIPVQDSFIEQQKISNYFLFKKIEVIDNKASAEFEYRFLGNSELNSIRCILTLNKSEGSWIVTNKECRKEVNHE